MVSFDNTTTTIQVAPTYFFEPSWSHTIIILVLGGMFGSAIWRMCGLSGLPARWLIYMHLRAIKWWRDRKHCNTTWPGRRRRRHRTDVETGIELRDFGRHRHRRHMRKCHRHVPAHIDFNPSVDNMGNAQKAQLQENEEAVLESREISAEGRSVGERYG